MPKDQWDGPLRLLQPRRLVAAVTPLLLVATACGAAAPEGGGDGDGAPDKLVVWDWKSGDEAAEEYFEQAKADFHEKHPDVEVEFVAQLYDQYYTLLGTAIESGMGVDTNADHFAAYRLDAHGNPVGNPRRFFSDLSGTGDHRDAQVRHAITRLPHWAKRVGVRAIGIENLDFTAEKTREKHGRKKRFRQLISGIPPGRLRARLVSMAAEQDLSIVAVDPAYTSVWGNQHWRKPLTSNKRKMSRHDAAGIAIGRRALGHPIRRRTAPPHDDRSDRRGHRTAQAGPGARGREETRHPVTERAHDARRRTGIPRTRATSASNTVPNARSSGTWHQMPLLDTVEER